MTAQITIIGLGPGSIGSINQETLQAIESAQVDTSNDSSSNAHLIKDAISFDAEYERHDSFDEVYTAIAKQLIAAAHQHQQILYAVPGSPLVLEQTVQHLLQDTTVDVVLIPAMSFWMLRGTN